MTSIDLAALTAPNQGKLTKRFLDTDESAEPHCKVIWRTFRYDLNSLALMFCSFIVFPALA